MQAAVDKFDSLNSQIKLQKSILRLWKEESKWRDISTAPKDGSQVLSKCGNTLIVVTYFKMKEGNCESGFWVASAIERFHTHWRPLPQPPKDGE